MLTWHPISDQTDYLQSINFCFKLSWSREWNQQKNHHHVLSVHNLHLFINPHNNLIKMIHVLTLLPPWEIKSSKYISLYLRSRNQTGLKINKVERGAIAWLLKNTNSWILMYLAIVSKILTCKSILIILFLVLL